MSVILLLLLFVAASVVGYKAVSNVPSLLHTPLMSGMNALSGITITGAIAAAAVATAIHSQLLGVLAVILATINIVAGFVVTHRMLKMFKKN